MRQSCVLVFIEFFTGRPYPHENTRPHRNPLGPWAYTGLPTANICLLKIEINEMNGSPRRTTEACSTSSPVRLSVPSWSIQSTQIALFTPKCIYPGSGVTIRVMSTTHKMTPFHPSPNVNGCLETPKALSATQFHETFHIKKIKTCSACHLAATLLFYDSCIVCMMSMHNHMQPPQLHKQPRNEIFPSPVRAKDHGEYQLHVPFREVIRCSRMRYEASYGRKPSMHNRNGSIQSPSFREISALQSGGW